MGTRSVLGMENKPGKIYYQYMQFDGYPTEKGKKFYEAIMDSLAQGKTNFGDEKGPNSRFFSRIKCYFNEIQWATHHSIGAHYTINKNEWKSVDACQEWQYLFDKGGNFIFFPIHSNMNNYVCTIPWEFTWRVASEWNSNGCNSDEKLGDFWKLCEEWTHNKRLVSLGIECGEFNAFPEQNSTPFPNAGYRSWVCLTLNGKELMHSMFYNVKSINRKGIGVKFESEYFKIKNTPVDQLPLLIGNIKGKECQKLLDERMREGK